MGRYIPGNPNLLVRNMPGGGTMIAANYVYGVAEPDGTTLGSIFPTLYFAQLSGRKEVNSIGRSSLGSARRSTTAAFSMRALTDTKPWTTCAKPRSRRNARPRPSAPPAITFPN